MDTIQIDGWQGRLGEGLAPRQLLAVLWAATDKTAKEIARLMDCSHYTVKQQLDDARFKLGNHRTTRGLCLEAMKRGIISPLVLMLCLATGFGAMNERPNQRPVRTARASVMQVYRQEVA